MFRAPPYLTPPTAPSPPSLTPLLPPSQIGWFDLEKNSSGILTTRLAADAPPVGGGGARSEGRGWEVHCG